VSHIVQISRVKRTRQEARAAYNAMSRWYDAFAGTSERRLVDAGLKKLAASTGETVLEIGFGTGHALLALAYSVGNSGRVYGIDLSDNMVEIARERVEKADLAERVALQHGDATRLPYKEALFDAVFASFTLELFDTPDIPKVLCECRRVMQVDGRLCLVSLAQETDPSIALRMYEWAHAKLPRYVDCRPFYAKQATANANFRVVDVTRKAMWGLPVDIVLAENVL
jgi:ubiquinone/menaquinone biosynthesis C-methylase UbiE